MLISAAALVVSESPQAMSEAPCGRSVLVASAAVLGAPSSDMPFILNGSVIGLPAAGVNVIVVCAVFRRYVPCAKHLVFSATEHPDRSALNSSRRRQR